MSDELQNASISHTLLRRQSSLVKGIEALTVLLRAHRSLGITQIASALGISKSTAHDLLKVLCELDFVDQNTDTRRYAVSAAIFEFVHLISTEYGLNLALKPILRARAAKLKATLVITALSGNKTYMLCATGSGADTFRMGDNGPPYNSACGKILVAQRPDSEWPAFAPQPNDKPYTSYSNLSPIQFLNELAAARQNGYAVNVRQREADFCSIATPLNLGDKPWNRAIAIMLPYSEWVIRDRAELAAELNELAKEISKALTR